MNWKARFTNPWFYVAVVGTILAASGIEAETLTNWPVLAEALLAIVLSPFRLGTVLVALLGDFYNPSTKGLKD